MEGNYWWLTFRYTFIHLWKEIIKSSRCVWSQNTGECNICDVSPGEATWSVVTAGHTIVITRYSPPGHFGQNEENNNFLCYLGDIFGNHCTGKFTKEHIVKQSRILNLLADLWRFITNYRWKPLELYSRVSCCGLCELELNLWTCPNWNMLYAICLRLPNIYHHHHFLNTHTLSFLFKRHENFVTLRGKSGEGHRDGNNAQMVKMKKHLYPVRFGWNDTFVQSKIELELMI